MNPRISKRFITRLCPAILAALALCAFAAVGSAAAATQHWASADQLPYGGSQSFTGHATSEVFEMQWRLSGIKVDFACETQSVSGTARNPAAGGDGTLSADSFELGGCVNNAPGCELENHSMSFVPLQGNAYTESGEDRIEFKPAAGTVAAYATLRSSPESVCLLSGSYVIKGSFSASAVAGNPGEYVIDGGGLGQSGFSVSLNGRFALSTPSEEALALSSDGSPNGAHWYLGSTEWTTLPTGESIAYEGNGPMSFGIDVKIAGTGVKITCDGSSNGVAGSLENPAGGGAGTATAAFTFGECEQPISGCVIQSPAHSVELSGVATEVGEAPAVELSPVEGTTVVVFAFENSEGSSCPLRGSVTAKGKLIATSEGDGHFNLAASELRVGKQKAITSGSFALESEAGESLRLQQ